MEPIVFAYERLADALILDWSLVRKLETTSYDAVWKRALTSGISICVGVFIALLTTLLLCSTHKVQEIAAYGSQMMCPSCGLITSRSEERCLECRQLLRPVQVTVTVEN